jgi:hypothetical protein
MTVLVAKTGPASLGEKVVAYARHRLGDVVGNGECFTLADRALQHAGAKRAEDCMPPGAVTEEADYVWGEEVLLDEVQPGDIIQTRDYVSLVRIETPDSWHEDEQQRGHHTAIVESVGDHGSLTVLEQNVPPGQPVQRIKLYFDSGTFTEGGTTTKVSVTGQFWFYRPQPLEDEGP